MARRSRASQTPAALRRLRLAGFPHQSGRLRAASASADRYHLTAGERWRLAVLSPIFHEPSASIERIGPSISRNDGVANPVRQREFDCIAGIISAFGSPIGEAAAEAVDRQ